MEHIWVIPVEGTAIDRINLQDTMQAERVAYEERIREKEERALYDRLKRKFEPI